MRPELFQRMYINPVGLGDDVLDKELRVGKLAKVFSEELVADLVTDPRCYDIIRYVLFLYDPKTPLREHFPDIQERKEMAANMAGFEDSDPELEILFTLANEHYSRAVYDILKHFSNKTLTLLVTNEELFWSVNRRVLMEVVDYKSSKEIEDAYARKMANLEKAEKIAETIERLENKLFATEEEADEVKRHAGSSPESRAHRN